MAITALKVLHRSFIPGAVGYDTSGNPKQSKIRVIGEFNNSTSYTAGGEVILRNKLGLGAVDTAQFWVKGTLPDANGMFVCQWDDTNQKFVCSNIRTGGAGACVIREPIAALGVVRFEMTGDAPTPTEVVISDTINNP